MKLIPLFLFCTLATAAAEIPSLINYQGRLVSADGSAQSGQKSFLLEVFDAASAGSLLYREEIGAIPLGEGGVYSFQFGATGTSNTQVTETIGTGGEENLYQQVLSNLPVVAGSVSVSDGTYTWSQSAGSSNEDDFSGSFSTNLNRITVNYFSGAPNDGRSIDVTYRHQSEGITGALSSGGEHWLQLTIGGDVQATRERVLAVPFALRAGAVTEIPRRRKTKAIWMAFENRTLQTIDGHDAVWFPVPGEAKKLISLKAKLLRHGRPEAVPTGRTVEIKTAKTDTSNFQIVLLKKVEVLLGPEVPINVLKEYTFPLDYDLQDGVYYRLTWEHATGGNFDNNTVGPLILEYEY